MKWSHEVLLICLISFGCATAETALRLYDGPPRPGSEVAVLRNKAGNLWLVDGVNPRCGTCHATSIEMLPGSHTVSVEIGGAGTGIATSPVTASFAAVAGHTYELSARILEGTSAGGTWTPVIKDITSGAVVFP